MAQIPKPVSAARKLALSRTATPEQRTGAREALAASEQLIKARRIFRAQGQKGQVKKPPITGLSRT